MNRCYTSTFFRHVKKQSPQFICRHLRMIPDPARHHLSQAAGMFAVSHQPFCQHRLNQNEKKRGQRNCETGKAWAWVIHGGFLKFLGYSKIIHFTGILQYKLDKPSIWSSHILGNLHISGIFWVRNRFFWEKNCMFLVT